MEGVVSVETESAEIATNHSVENENRNVQENSETESISEHIPSKVEDSLTDTDNGQANNTHEQQDSLKVETEQEKVSITNSLNIPYTYSPISENPSAHDPNKSWPIDVNAVSDVHHISEESPVNLALSSDISKEGATQDNKSQSVPQTPLVTDHTSPEESPRSDKYVDSLNEESIQKSLGSEEDKSLGQISCSSLKEESLEHASSGSEEIIKLDIRGQGVPKFSLPTAKIIFGPPPEGSTILDPNIDTIPVFQNLLSPFLVGAGDSLKVEEVFDFSEHPPKELSPDKSIEISPEKSLEISPDKSLELSIEKQSLSSDKSEQKDLLIEELTIDNVKEKVEEKQDEPSITTQPKSMAPEETMSFSTLTTDYKTICEEYHEKVVVIIIDGLCYCIYLAYMLVLLCILILLTPMACYFLTFYRKHFLIYDNVTKLFLC